MFTKHVWHDARHRAEIYISDSSLVSGVIIAYQGAVCLINPRTEILSALYNETGKTRLLSINTIILTDNTIDFTRGICAFINYSRALHRQAPLSIISHSQTTLPTDFLNSFCSRMQGAGGYRIDMIPVAVGTSVDLGMGTVRFVQTPEQHADTNPFLAVSAGSRTVHYYDETHSGNDRKDKNADKDLPDVVIRAAELLKKSRETA